MSLTPPPNPSNSCSLSRPTIVNAIALGDLATTTTSVVDAGGLPRIPLQPPLVAGLGSCVGVLPALEGRLPHHQRHCRDKQGTPRDAHNLRTATSVRSENG